MAEDDGRKERKESSSSTDLSSISFSISDLRDNSGNNFKGFIDEFNFTASALVQISFCFSIVLLSIHPNFLTSAVAFVSMMICSTWMELHNKKLTRNEVIYFEVSNLLEVDPPVFTFGLPAPFDDCLTPGDGEQRELPGPQTLWQALFADEKKLRMDKFYRKHYGRVHETGEKMLKEYEMQKAKEKQSPNPSPSTP